MALQQCFECTICDGVISDIYDGDGYKCHAAFLSHVSLLLNTDGVALFRSFSRSIWPIWAVVNELPAKVK